MSSAPGPEGPGSRLQAPARIGARDQLQHEQSGAESLCAGARRLAPGACRVSAPNPVRLAVMRRLLLPVLAATALGCLKAGPPVQGRQLYAGREIEKPTFVGVNNAADVMFQVRTALAMPPRSATYDLWLG